MSSRLHTIDDLEVCGRRVLVRADLNVPLDHGRVVDDSRITAALPTIEELRERGAAIVLMSHLGRPHGIDPSLSLRPVAERLAELTDAPVTLAPAVVGDAVRRMAAALAPGEILLLENVRFEAGETVNDPVLSQSFAALGNAYVDDAFGTAHRAHASTEGVAHLLPSAAGRLMERELEALSSVLEHPARPLVAVLGGAKVADKIGVVRRFLEIADRLLIGGAMAFPFLSAQGHRVGASRCDPGDLEVAAATLAGAPRGRLQLPVDLVIAEAASTDARRRTIDCLDVPDGWIALDIGPRTAEQYAGLIQSAGTVFWNGPMGVFELDPFAAGTRAIAGALAGTSATTIAGGGETVAALREFGLTAQIDHVSTGGGATLELIEGRALPGVQALMTSDGDAPKLVGVAGAGSADEVHRR
jgi:phosphoglycerate kinase